LGNPCFISFTGEDVLKQSIVHIALVVKNYDEAIAFYTQKLHFTLVEDTYQPEQDKRWVVVSPPGSIGTTLLLARASRPEQVPFIGNQAGGRVFLFLNTDDFWRDYNEMVSKGIKFVRAPKEDSYGLVAVFEDLYGNISPGRIRQVSKICFTSLNDLADNLLRA
jgi:catechol 2,3-dioxygenase-like lactoylglutathione lyase family enzyme